MVMGDCDVTFISNMVLRGVRQEIVRLTPGPSLRVERGVFNIIDRVNNNALR